MRLSVFSYISLSGHTLRAKSYNKSFFTSKTPSTLSYQEFSEGLVELNLAVPSFLSTTRCRRLILYLPVPQELVIYVTSSFLKWETVLQPKSWHLLCSLLLDYIFFSAVSSDRVRKCVHVYTHIHVCTFVCVCVYMYLKYMCTYACFINDKFTLIALIPIHSVGFLPSIIPYLYIHFS